MVSESKHGVVAITKDLQQAHPVHTFAVSTVIIKLLTLSFDLWQFESNNPPFLKS